MYLVVGLTHAIYPKLTPLLRARRKTECHAIAKTHTANSESHIQQIHWHHQIFTKPCARCVRHKESSVQLSHHRQQITRCTAHAPHQPLTSPSLNQTMRTVRRTQEKSIRLSCHQQLLRSCTAHSPRPLTPPNLDRTMRTLCEHTKKIHFNCHTTDGKSHCAQLLHHSMEHIRRRNQNEMLNEIQALNLATFPFSAPTTHHW